MKRILILFLLSAVAAFAQPAITHHVALAWGASVVDATHLAPTSYNVFKATTSGGYGTTPLANVPAPATTYSDPIPITDEGKTFFYVVTAVLGGGESARSNETSATIPFSVPNIPPNLTSTIQTP